VTLLAYRATLPAWGTQPEFVEILKAWSNAAARQRSCCAREFIKPKSLGRLVYIDSRSAAGHNN